MKKLEEHIKTYHAYHETRFTKITHAIAIPTLSLAFLILLSWFRIDVATRWHLDFVWLLVFFLVLYYISLHVGLGLLMGVLLSLLSWFADWIAGPMPSMASVTIFLVLFIPSTLLIWAGHHHEKRHAHNPKLLYHFAMAPLLLMIDLLDQLGITRLSK